LKAEEEIRNIFGQLKNLLLAEQEMRSEPPFIPSEVRSYLEGSVSAAHVHNHELAHLDTLEALRAFIGECTRCSLHKGRKHLVFGEGFPQARLVFVGEGPGREEDTEGRPFVGEAGRLLTRIIKAMELTREEVYICNVVKCRPPGNRDPETDEIETCIPFLKQQLTIIRPEVVCTLGRVAGQGLLGADFKITMERGNWHSYENISLMPTYHPAYLLRNPGAKRQVWEDVQKIMTFLGLEVKKND